MEERQMKCKESWTITQFPHDLKYIQTEKLKKLFPIVTSATHEQYLA